MSTPKTACLAASDVLPRMSCAPPEGPHEINKLGSFLAVC